MSREKIIETSDPIVQRMIELLQEKGKSEREFVKSIGLSNGTMTKWKQGGKAYIKYLPEIAQYFGVSEKYLLSGMERNTSHDLSEMEENLIRLYRLMTPHRRHAFMMIGAIFVNED